MCKIEVDYYAVNFFSSPKNNSTDSSDKGRCAPLAAQVLKYPLNKLFRRAAIMLDTSWWCVCVVFEVRKHDATHKNDEWRAENNVVRWLGGATPSITMCAILLVVYSLLFAQHNTKEQSNRFLAAATRLTLKLCKRNQPDVRSESEKEKREEGCFSFCLINWQNMHIHHQCTQQNGRLAF